MSQIEMGSAASAPQGNPAAIRWFDLLATDAGKDGVQAALTLSEATPDRGHAQNVGDGLEVTPLQQATRVIDEHDKKSDDAQSGPQPQVEGSDRVSSRLLERRLWQAENDIRLLPREQVLFSKFVHEICLSVCFSSLMTLSLYADLKTSSIFVILGELSRRWCPALRYEICSIHHKLEVLTYPSSGTRV